MLYPEGVCKMNYSRKHLKAVSRSMLWAWFRTQANVNKHNCKDLYKQTSRHYSNIKSYNRW